MERCRKQYHIAIEKNYEEGGMGRSESNPIYVADPRDGPQATWFQRWSKVLFNLAITVAAGGLLLYKSPLPETLQTSIRLYKP